MPISRSARKWWRKATRPSRIVLHGQRLRITSPHMGPTIRRALLRGRYERHKVRQLRNRVEPNDVVLDVGGGIGLTALYAASMVGAENVVCLEADPRAATLAEVNFAANGQDIELLRAAAVPGGDPADVDFHLNEELGRSSLTSKAGDIETVSVPTADVAPLLRGRGISVLNVAVEGSERDLLTAIDDFADVRILLLSVHEQVVGYERTNRLLERLFDAGFALDLPDSRGRHIALARYRFS
ncbi:MAG: FkbM family methyltransferase [Gammaproteobacteria bacterium]|nr:FkbM family methyltransferase [Gammaproteobacteria bacterium]